jgi:hypothetical protein
MYAARSKSLPAFLALSFSIPTIGRPADDGTTIAPIDADRGFAAGSKVATRSLSPRQIDTLVITGKTWGFLKYHHPAITGGSKQWDYELLRRLPRLLEADSRAQAEQLLVEWIDSLGAIAPCRPCAVGDESAPLEPRLGWLNDAGAVGPDLRARLKSVYANRTSTQAFVSLAAGVGNPEFKHESEYARLKLPDTGFQILALLRFWNVIEYWFPYRDLIDEDWDEVLRDALPRIALARDEEEYRREMMALVARADDGHANLWSEMRIRPPVGDCALPASIRHIENAFVVERVATSDSSGLRAGDVLVSLDGRPVSDIAAHVRRYYGASNDSARMRDIANSLTRGECGSVSVVVQREGNQSLTAQRVAPVPQIAEATVRNDRPGGTFQLLSPEVAYLKLSSIKAADLRVYVEQVRDARVLVVDIRNYPSEFVVRALGSLLVDAPTPFARFTLPDLANPGAFRWGPTAELSPAAAGFTGRVAILVDETSQSQAEYTAMALRASPRALVVGSTTAGADGNISNVPLPGGLRAAISGIGVYYPDRRPTQQVGVAVDVECRDTIAGLRDGRDETLECALRALDVPMP